MTLKSLSLITAFPEFFDSPFQSSILRRALGRDLSSSNKNLGGLDLHLIPLRSFGEGRHRSIDDRPFGGGAGMVLKPQVLEAALGSVFLPSSEKEAEISLKSLESLSLSVQNFRKDFFQKNSLKERENFVLHQWSQSSDQEGPPWVIALSPQGLPWSSALARRFSQVLEHRKGVLVCGHYEGFDERFIESYVHLEVSVGDFVMTGGEPAALCLLDSLSRFLPGVVGSVESVNTDSFEKDGLLKYRQYTRPDVFHKQVVPEVLLSGNHGHIEDFRRQDALTQTQKKRPDLLSLHHQSQDDQNSLSHRPRVDVVLLHYPIYNRKQEVVTTAVTNMDLHDLARSCRTYGVKNTFIVNPEAEQKRWVSRLLDHWKNELSQIYHPARYEALSRLQWADTFDQVIDQITQETGVPPYVLMPDARPLENAWGYSRARHELLPALELQGRSLVIVLGTGWGITPEFYPKVHGFLAPLQGVPDPWLNQKEGKTRPFYHHLSVRAACAIILDRLFGQL